MALPISFLVSGRQVRVRSGGDEITGTIVHTANGWMRMTASNGDVLVNLATVTWIHALGPAPERDEANKPEAHEIGDRQGSRVPGRPWSEASVKTIIDGFLSDQQDSDLAETHGRTRHQITVLRHAWECARGNMTEDRISPAAQEWVPRIRRILRPE
ncbi:MAG: hypothetical protein AAB263_07755 [Planctomycetota bacterium]